MSLRQFLTNLNLFQSISTDPDTIRQEKISTRIYLILFILSIIVLTAYAAFSIQTVNVTKYNPSASEFQHLYSRYSDTIKCSCSRIAIPYSQFIQYSATFHEVCSSDFISQTWIELVYTTNHTYIVPNDVRKTLSTFWQTIQMLCTLTKKTLVNVLDDFSSMLLLTPQAQPLELIETNAKTALQFSLTAAVTTLRRNFRIMQQSIVSNQFISALGTNFQWYAIADHPYTQYAVVTVANRFSDNCSCWGLDGCSRPGVIFELNETIVSGMVFNCQPFTGILASSLECFYQPECMNLIGRALSINFTFISLLMAESRFAQNSTIETLFDELMIEKWTNVTSYDSYYNQCNPSYCTYSYSERMNVVFVLKFLIGAFGGLCFALNFGVPFLIKLVFRIYSWLKRRHLISNNDQSTLIPWRQKIQIKIRSWISSLWSSLINLNVYKSPTRDEHKIYRQRMATRLFIVSLIVCLVTISIYMFVSIQTKTITVQNPSQLEYEHLYENYSSTLRCMCSQSAIPFSDFVKIIPHFHQLCSSDLISNTWYNQLQLTDRQKLWIDSTEWINIGSVYFQQLATFCFLSQNTINDTYRIFAAKKLVSSVVVPKNIFLQEIQAAIDTYIRSTYVEFTRSLSLLRNNIYLNQFVTATMTNVRLYFQLFDYISMSPQILAILIPSSPYEYISPCTCGPQGSECAFYAYFVNSLEVGVALTSLNVRCFPIDSALTSTLECWYDPDCLHLIPTTYTIYGLTNFTTISPLNAGAIIRFSINATVETLVNELLLENWTTTIAYYDFYKSCAPLSCTYNVEERFDLFFVIIVAFSVYSGLTQGLRLISPFVFRVLLMIVQRCRRRRRRRVLSQSTTITHVQLQGSNSSIRIKLQKYLSEFNLFETYTSSVETLRQERLTTRVYVVVLIVCIATLIFYTGLVEHTESRTILKPSQPVYHGLVSEYSDTLECPCGRVSIAQHEFITYLHAILHPVCSSALVSIEWKKYMEGPPGRNRPPLQTTDFRERSVLFFSMLTSFCSMANSTVISAIEDFQSRTFISAQIMSPITFETQIKSAIDLFEKSTTSAFANCLGSIRLVSQSNALITILGSNWNPKFRSNDLNIPFFLSPVLYNDGSCSCATSSSRCIQSTGFFDWNGTQFYTVENIFYGCTPFDSILLSSLGCFFSNSCLTDFLHGFPHGSFNMFWGTEIFPMSPLTFSSTNSNFRENDTIQSIVDRLFIDSWSSEISYERYYNACAPLQCTYSYGRRLDIVYVFMTLLSGYSSLSAVLRYLISGLIFVSYQIKNWWIRRRFQSA